MAESAAHTWVSIDSVRLVCLGISLYVAALHLTLARKGHPANIWVSVWALATALVQITGISRSQATDLADAVAPARLAVATVPVLVGGLVFVVRSLTGRRISRGAVAGLALATLAFGAVATGTPLFLVGAPKPSVGPAMPLIGVVLAIAFVAMVREARALERHDRVVLWASMLVYVGASIFAVVLILFFGIPFHWAIGGKL